MGKSGWCRPTSVEFPKVWRHCKSKSGIDYRIQDVPSEMHEEIIEHMCTNFLRDEPASKCLGFIDDLVAVEDFKGLWRDSLKKNVSLMAIAEDGRIMGCNVLGIAATSDSKEFVDHFKSDNFKKMIQLMLVEITEKCDLFEHYGVQMHLSGLGLSVHPDFRGEGVAVELLKAREPMCRALGIPASGTTFSGVASQTAAARAGFELLAEVIYKEYKQDGEVVFANINSPSLGERSF